MSDETVREYIDRRLIESYRFHACCPECDFGLAVPHGRDEGAWCGLCGYERPTTLRPKELAAALPPDPGDAP